jgi:transposase-like protein
LNKNVEINVPCPKCKHLNKLTIAKLETNPIFVCDGCSKTVTVDASKFTKDLSGAKDMIKNHFKNLK